MGRNGIRPGDYQSFLTGINAIQSHLFKGRINGENAGMMACELMYLATCLLTGEETYERVTDPAEFIRESFSLKGMKRINYIRNTNPYAYGYLVKALKLLQKSGLYQETIL